MYSALFFYWRCRSSSKETARRLLLLIVTSRSRRSLWFLIWALSFTRGWVSARGWIQSHRKCCECSGSCLTPLKTEFFILCSRSFRVRHWRWIIRPNLLSSFPGCWYLTASVLLPWAIDRPRGELHQSCQMRKFYRIYSVLVLLSCLWLCSRLCPKACSHWGCQTKNCFWFFAGLVAKLTKFVWLLLVFVGGRCSKTIYRPFGTAPIVKYLNYLRLYLGIWKRWFKLVLFES
jgi:hypothetical protein